MHTLYHFWLCPYCRKIRIVLEEKSLSVKLKIEKVWKKRAEFMELNPAGEVPVFKDSCGVVISDSNAICEYLEEAYPEKSLLGKDIYKRSEIRRLIGWFDRKFYQEVTKIFIFEKILKKSLKKGWPDTNKIRLGQKNIYLHLEYISWLIERHNWLAGDEFSLADITAASHISCVDYFGHVPWDKYPDIKEWYVKIKSRPSFRTLLTDKMPGIAPSVHYADIDF